MSSSVPGFVNSDHDNNWGRVRFRHMGNTVTNTLMADGHVESFRVNPRRPPNSANVTDLLRKHVYVNPVK